MTCSPAQLSCTNQPPLTASDTHGPRVGRRRIPFRMQTRARLHAPTTAAVAPLLHRAHSCLRSPPRPSARALRAQYIRRAAALQPRDTACTALETRGRWSLPSTVRGRVSWSLGEQQADHVRVCPPLFAASWRGRGCRPHTWHLAADHTWQGSAPSSDPTAADSSWPARSAARARHLGSATASCSPFPACGRPTLWGTYAPATRPSTTARRSGRGRWCRIKWGPDELTSVVVVERAIAAAAAVAAVDRCSGARNGMKQSAPRQEVAVCAAGCARLRP